MSAMLWWSAVPGWLGFYVTSDGLVRGPSGRVLRPMSNDSGHLYVTRGRRSVKLYVHRAVLLAFVGPPPHGQEARHLNGNPRDNRLQNLAWGTKQEQRADDRRNGVLRKPGPLSSAQAREAYSLKGRESSRSIGRRMGVSHTTILKIQRGQRYVGRF
jgi:hypothetical protein